MVTYYQVYMLCVGIKDAEGRDFPLIPFPFPSDLVGVPTYMLHVATSSGSQILSRLNSEF